MPWKTNKSRFCEDLSTARAGFVALMGVAKSLGESFMPIDAKRVQSAFLAVIQFTDAAERAAELQRECGGDAELRRRVLALVAAHDQSGELPPAGSPPLD